ncbi:MAG TPA: hypothetical protein PLV25_00485 [Opitutales bacterium]|nr:hypothetical protein [Opitutales bacterium]
MGTSKEACIVFCGGDEFQVHREGERYVQTLRSAHPDWEFEVLAGAFQNQSEVATLLGRITESLRTLPLFGGGKCLWIKSFNGLSDSATAKSEKAQELFAALLSEIRGLNPAHVRLVMTAYPIDRRRKEYKALSEVATLTFIESGSAGLDIGEWVGSECARVGLRLTSEAQALLPELVRGSTRMLCAELEKLATYQGEQGPILDAADILELVPVFGESDFFAASEVITATDIPLIV